MKVFFALLLSFPFALFSLPFGNPAEPKTLDSGVFFKNETVAFSINYEKDMVLDQKLKAKGPTVYGQLDDFSRMSDLGGFTFNIKKRLDMYALFGASEVNFTLRPSLDYQIRNFQTCSHFTWQTGLKGIIFKNAHFCLSADAKIENMKAKMKWNTLNGVSFATNSIYYYLMWQTGVGLSYKIDLFTPYIALTASNVYAKLKGISPNLQLETSHFDMRNSNLIGLSLGCSLSKSKYFDVNLEVSLLNQTAISIYSKLEF